VLPFDSSQQFGPTKPRPVSATAIIDFERYKLEYRRLAMAAGLTAATLMLLWAAVLATNADKGAHTSGNDPAPAVLAQY